MDLSVTVVPAKDLDALLTKVAELTDADYDRLYIATFGKNGQGEVVVLHYGGSAPARDAR